MELDALILADAASVPEIGKFYIHGGGLTRYDVPGLPAPIPIATLVRLRIESGDLEKENRLNLALMGPMGIPNVEPFEILAIPPEEEPDLAEGQEQFLEFALTVPAVALRAGLYQLELRINGRLAKRVPLPVVVSGDLDSGSTGAGGVPEMSPELSPQLRKAKPRPQRPPSARRKKPKRKR